MSASARDTIEHELFEICGAPEYGVDNDGTIDPPFEGGVRDSYIAMLSAAEGKK